MSRYAADRQEQMIADDLTRLIDTANAPIIGIDALGKVNEWNQTVARITGFSKEEAIGQDLVETFITDDYKESVRDVLDRALAGDEASNYEFPLYTKAGQRIEVLLNSTTRRDAEGNVTGVVGVGQDITELAKTRREQQRIADDLTQLIDTANAPIIGIDALGKVNEWNQTVARITGFSKEEAIGQDLVETFITDDYKESVRDVLDRALAGDEASNYEFPLYTKAGQRIEVLLNSTTRRDAEGNVTGVVGVGQDITELAKTRREQQRIADDLTQLIDTANAPIIGIDALGKINEWNQSAERITGFTKEDTMGHDLVETFITDDHKEPVRDVLVRALAGDETSNYEFPLLTKSGETVHLLLNATTRRSSDASVLGVIGIGQDITARLEQEAMLRHRAKLESIGSLTGGIAHDFNNLLTVISGNLMLLEPHDEDDAEILEDARKAALDGAELVRGLLAFSRQQQLTPRWHNIRALLSEFQRSLVRSIGEAISLEIVLDDAGGAIFVDRTQFEAALLNLCINARDAISGSGQIRIEVHLHAAEPELLSSYGISGSDFGSFALIRVTDSGCGIEPHVLDKITEPFFTTKQAGEGSGLGLSSVTGFVKQSGGGLRIESEVGVGTRVSLLLPHGEGEESGSTPRTRAEREAAPSTGRGRTVLVVDDEPGVRKLAVRWLGQQGYHVLEAKSGDDALKLIEELDGAIDVVFSDIVMPGVLDGLALAKEVARRFPNIGIQLATGYDQERRFQAGSKEQMQFPVLIKPYDLNDLAASIHAQVRERG